MAAKKKKTTKKKAPATKRGRAVGATRPSYKVSAAATKAMATRKGLFFDLVSEVPSSVRVQPQLNGDPSLFTKSVLHYKMKDTEGNGIALGCLDHHGTKATGNYCYACAVAEWLTGQDDPALRKLGAGFGSFAAVPMLYVQLWVHNNVTKEWSGPKLHKVSAGIAGKLGDLISSAEDFGTTPFVDFDEGQIVVLKKTGQGKGTKYDMSSTGQVISMDDVDPNWEKSIIKDVPKKLDVKVWTIDQQKETLLRSFPDLPWDQIEKDIG